MNIITNSGTQVIDIDDIDYFYQDNLNIVFKLSNTTSVSCSFNTYNQARATIDQIFANYYKRLGAMPHSTGRCYIVNFSNIVSHSYVTVSHTITFDTNVLVVTGIGSTTPIAQARTLQDYKALTKYLYGYNFLATHAGGFIYVNPNGLEDYTTITAAIAGRTGTQAIVVRAGTYNETVAMGTFTIYCEVGVLITQKIEFETAGTTSYFLGYADLRHTATSVKGLNNTTLNDSYCEFRNIQGGDKTFYYYTGIAKGYSIESFNDATTVMLDTDGAVNFDLDVVKVIVNGNILFIQYTVTTGFATLRNGYFETYNSSDQIFSFSVSQMMKYNIVNARLNNTNNGIDNSNFSSISDTTVDEVNVWNSLFYTSGTDNFIASQNVTVNFYGNSYCNKGANSYIQYNGDSIAEEGLKLDSNVLMLNVSQHTDDIDINLHTSDDIPIINGYGEVRIHVESEIEAFILPIPNENGLEEYIIKESEITVLEKENEVIERIDGYRKRFRIHYDGLIDGAQCLKIASILEKEMEGHKIRLYPRNMNLQYNFLVYSSNTEMMIKVLKRGVTLGAMQGLILEFTTTKVFKKIGWMDITNLNSILENQMGYA